MITPDVEQALKNAEAQIETQRTIYALIDERMDAEEWVRQAKLELAKAENALAKARKKHEEFELKALADGIKANEDAVKKARNPSPIVGVERVLPGGLIKPA